MVRVVAEVSNFPYRHRTLKEVMETEALREKQRKRPLGRIEEMRLDELTRMERENNPPGYDPRWVA